MDSSDVLIVFTGVYRKLIIIQTNIKNMTDLMTFKLI